MEYTFFWGSNINSEKNYYFSQWFNFPIEENGIKFNCCEQYMMYHKAVLFQDNDIAKKILLTKNPKEQKALGRSVKNFSLEVWNKNLETIVSKGNYLKFNKEPLLGYLLNTKGTILVESSPFDRIYGVGMKRDNQSINDYQKWNGQNKLGFILTDLRIKLNKENNLTDESEIFINEYNIIKNEIKKKDFNYLISN